MPLAMPRIPNRKEFARRRAPAPGADKPGPGASELRRLQMADVARLAGVSISTVSRSLHGSPLISAETRKRVSELAESLNYSINLSAQNLRLRQNRTVAVVLPFERKTRRTLADPFAEAMLSTLADELNDHGYTMQLLRVPSDAVETVAQLQAAGSAIGMLIIGAWTHQEQLNELAARGFPLVVWGAGLPQQLYCSISSDNVAGGLMATRHLLETGRRRIAFFGDINVPEVAQRYDGHCQAMTETALAIDPQLCVSAGFHAEDARQATMALLRRGVMFDAIFACNDALAIATISNLREMNVRVPDDVAVIGYDDIELAAFTNPTLTTVRQPIQSAGRALVDGLIALVEGKRPAPLLLPTELVVRQSSARAPRRAGRRAAAPAT